MLQETTSVVHFIFVLYLKKLLYSNLIMGNGGGNRPETIYGEELFENVECAYESSGKS